jgi:alpha-tubulin suppressor-like RCC1 family protein
LRILTKDGRIVVCGKNSFGECGNGTQTAINTLTVLPVNSVQKLRCSFDNTHYINTLGVSYFCGRNSYGEAGLSNTTAQLYFKQTNTNVLEIGAMYGTTWWFKTNGDIYWAGTNQSGQAGINSSTITSTSAMTKNNTITTSTDGLIVLSNLTNSSFGSPIFSANSSVRHCGANTHGEIGNGSVASKVVAVYSIPLTSMGTWDNVYYASKDLFKTFILTKDFQLYACGGANTNSGTYLPDGSTDVTTMKLMANMPWY